MFIVCSMKIKTIIVGLVFLGLLIILGVLFIRSNEQNRYLEEAKTVVSAIYKFERINQRFPDQLPDLVPSYLKSISKDWTGHELFYSTDKVNGFTLSVIIRASYGCGYTNKTKEWECGFGD